MTDEERARAWLDKWVYNDDDGPNLDRPLEALLAVVRAEEREAMHYVVRPTGDVTTDPCGHSEIMQASGCGGCELALRDEIDRLRNAEVALLELRHAVCEMLKHGAIDDEDHYVCRVAALGGWR